MSSLSGRDPRDANRVPADFGVSSTDGVTVIPMEINPSTGRLLVDAILNSSSIILGQVEITDGTTIANVLPIGTGQNALVTGGGRAEVSGTASGLSQDIVPSTDVSAYNTFVIQITGTFSGTLTFQHSNDGASWVSMPVQGSIINNNLVTITTGTGVFIANRQARYIRIRMTSYVSGTASGICDFYTSQTLPYATTAAAQQGTWTVGSNSATGSAVPANAFYFGLNGGGNLTGLAGTADNSDGRATTSTANRGLVVAENSLYNESTFDRFRNNTELSVLASAARTVTTSSTDLTNYNGTKLMVFVNVSSAGTGSITPTLQVKDPVSGNYFTYWTATTAITANGQYAYIFANGATGGSFVETVGIGLPARTWRFTMTHNNANSITYSVSGVVSL